MATSSSSSPILKEFSSLFETLKSLYEFELYDDVKILADLLISLVESYSPDECPCEPKDKYSIYFMFAQAAFSKRECLLAESLFNKALQLNKLHHMKLNFKGACDVTQVSKKYQFFPFLRLVILFPKIN
jgi:hypothetical protein